jgi:hypothetical protein
VGTAYSQTLAATGGTGGGYTWLLTAGVLPAGLSLSALGVISGTPPTAGTLSFTVQVRDSAGSIATAPLAITINPPPLAITTSALASGTAGTPYVQSLAASGGTGAYRWSAVSGSLPTGLALSAGGAITGTPSTPGLFNFTVQVADGTSTPATQALSITIRAPLAVTGTLPSGTTGVPYGAAVAASGGVPPYNWSVKAGQLPPGLAADNAGNVVGVPTRAGIYSFTLQASDAAGTTAAAAFTVTIISNLGVVTPPTLASGSAGAAYQATLAASGGTPPYSWSLISGTLPNGLALNGASGMIGGTPTQVGTFTVGVRVTDANSNTATESVTVTIFSGLAIATAPVLPGATAGSPYSQQLQPAGGVPPYVWAATAGSLPAGLLFHASGLIDGTPAAAGTFAFTVEVTDGNTTKATKQFTLEVAGPLTITSGPALPGGTTGGPYSQTLAASGGRPPLVWSVAAGTLPPGLSLAATGTLSGTPSASGNFSFTAAVTDSAGIKAQKALTLAVGAGVTPSAPSSLPNAVAGTPYTFTFGASGGQQPYTWSVTGGALPAGLDLNAASGVLSGTPTATGTFNFTVQVTDAARLTASRVHAIVVGLPAAPSLSVNGLPASAGPLEQPQVDIILSTPYPVPVTGRLNLTFAPGGQNPVDDPAVQFSTGGRSATFTVPANATHATFTAAQLALQTGSVAGTITVTVDALAAGGAPMQVPAGITRTLQVNTAAPAIRSLTVTRTGSGFNVVVVALSDTRELTQATVGFQAAAGGTLQSSQAIIPLAGVSSTWFKGPDSAAYGGQFTLTLPFTITGSSAALGSVSVVLSNSAGDSPASSAQY